MTRHQAHRLCHGCQLRPHLWAVEGRWAGQDAAGRSIKPNRALCRTISCTICPATKQKDAYSSPCSGFAVKPQAHLNRKAHRIVEQVEHLGLPQRVTGQLVHNLPPAPLGAAGGLQPFLWAAWSSACAACSLSLTPAAKEHCLLAEECEQRVVPIPFPPQLTLESHGKCRQTMSRLPRCPPSAPT